MRPIKPGSFCGTSKTTLKGALISESESWFVLACKQLVPKDPGFALNITTDFPSSTCYRYAAEGVTNGGDFVRALLRSEQGWTWLGAIMDGAEPEWWRAVQAAESHRAKLEEIRAVIERV